MDPSTDHRPTGTLSPTTPFVSRPPADWLLLLFPISLLLSLPCLLLQSSCRKDCDQCRRRHQNRIRHQNLLPGAQQAPESNAALGAPRAPGSIFAALGSQLMLSQALIPVFSVNGRGFKSKASLSRTQRFKLAPTSRKRLGLMLATASKSRQGSKFVARRVTESNPVFSIHGGGF